MRLCRVKMNFPVFEHPGQIEPVEQVLDGKLYMHQHKVNA